MRGESGSCSESNEVQDAFGEPVACNVDDSDLTRFLDGSCSGLNLRRFAICARALMWKHLDLRNVISFRWICCLDQSNRCTRLCWLLCFGKVIWISVVCSDERVVVLRRFVEFRCRSSRLREFDLWVFAAMSRCHQSGNNFMVAHGGSAAEELGLISWFTYNCNFRFCYSNWLNLRKNHTDSVRNLHLYLKVSSPTTRITPPFM